MSAVNPQLMTVVPGAFARGVTQMMPPPMMGMARDHTGQQMLPGNFRSMHMNFTNPRYRAAPSYAPASAAPAPSYAAQPKPAAPYAAAPAAPYAASASAPAAYAKAPASGYDGALQSSANYGQVSSDEYNRAKLKLYPVNMYPAAPPIEIITNEGTYDAPSNYNYTKPTVDSAYGAPGYGALPAAGPYAAPPAAPAGPYVLPAAGPYAAPPAAPAGSYALPAAGPYAAPAPATDYVAPADYSAPIAPPPAAAYAAPADLYAPSAAYPAPAPAPYGAAYGGAYGGYGMPVAVSNIYCSKGKKCSCTLYLTEINANNMLISGVCSGLCCL